MGKNKKSKNCTEVGIQVETTNNILLKTKKLEMEIPINENPFLWDVTVLGQPQKTQGFQQNSENVSMELDNLSVRQPRATR